MKLAQFLTRLVVIVFVCGLMAFANVVPAIAAHSKLNEGMEQLSNIQTKAENAAKSGPYDGDLVKSKANRGLNEIQGTSDFRKMKQDVNDETLPAVSQIEKTLDKVGDKANSAKDDTQNGITSVLDKAGDAASYVKDKAGDAINSLTEKAGDTVESIKR